MSGKPLCRLCLTPCKDSKELYDDFHVYETTVEYFDSEFLNLRDELTEICMQCWSRITGFHTYQESVMLAQFKFVDTGRVVRKQWCRLCLNTCHDCEELYGDLEVHKVVFKYFDPANTAVCSKCWTRIIEFQIYHETAMKAQSKFVDEADKIEYAESECYDSSLGRNRLCRLCLKTCKNFKELSDDLEVHEVVFTYFDKAYFELTEHITALCSNCWSHITDFHSYRETVMKAQWEFVYEADEVNHAVSECYAAPASDPKATLGRRKLCRLCLNTCIDFKQLYDDLEVHEVVFKYFDSAYLDLKEHITALCSKCWSRIIEFHIYQQSVMKAQSQLVGEADTIEYAEDSEYAESECYDDPPSEQSSIHEPKDELSIGDYAVTVSKLGLTGNSLGVDEAKEAKRKTVTNLSAQTDQTNKSKSPTKKKSAKDRDAFIAQWSATVECDICKETFPTVALLQIHFRHNHPNVKKSYVVCCKRKFRGRDKLEEHISVHLDPNVFQCQACRVSFKSRVGLAKHPCHQYQKAVLQPNGAYKCSDCGEVFETIKAMHNHIFMNHGEPTFSCPHCPKVYTSRASLADHEASHAGIDLYACDLCDKTYKHRGTMRKHRKFGHAQ